MRPRPTSYRRLSQAEGDEEKSSVEENVENEIEELKERMQEKSVSRAEWVSTKIHAVLWIVGAASLAYFLDVFRVAFRDARVHRYDIWCIQRCFDRLLLKDLL
ncbi:unnamed protein product [Aphanomyces euteiches]